MLQELTKEQAKQREAEFDRWFAKLGWGMKASIYNCFKGLVHLGEWKWENKDKFK